MDKLLLNGMECHPDYEAAIDEVLKGSFDPDLMAQALSYTKSKSQAEALYVWLKLAGS
jgi:hypothetical protein